jgi:hypothetical protein
MNPDILTLIGMFLGSSVLSSLVTAWVMRRKITAEAAAEEVDTTGKVSDLLKEMQSQNVDLYKQNTALEKVNTDQTRTIEILTARLESRDSQLAAATKQLDLLRSLAEQTPITEILRTQLDSVNQVVLNLQIALADGQKIMQEKDNAMQELLKTNRDLVLKKPPKA